LKKTPISIAILLLTIGLFVACEQAYTPRPIGYARIYFPEKNYTLFDSSHCSFQFEIPEYSNMTKDPKYTQPHPCWYNLVFEPFDATLHLSYHSYHSNLEFDSLFEDTRRLVYKHITRADDIEEIDIVNHPHNVSGLIYQLKGNTATHFNFYVTDQSHQYVRGALYFNQKTNPDSIAPVFEFIQQDIMHLIKTFRFQ
jgi:gliding motility-associated lipoprotein GldD